MQFKPEHPMEASMFINNIVALVCSAGLNSDRADKLEQDYEYFKKLASLMTVDCLNVVKSTPKPPTPPPHSHGREDLAVPDSRLVMPRG